MGPRKPLLYNGGESGKWENKAAKFQGPPLWENTVWTVSPGALPHSGPPGEAMQEEHNH